MLIGLEYGHLWLIEKIFFSFELTALLNIPMAFYGTVCMDINYRCLFNQYYVLLRIKAWLKFKVCATSALTYTT